MATSSEVTCTVAVDEDGGSSSSLLPRRTVVLYCGACGMPPEYCEYGPDFETHCDPWLQKHHPTVRAKLAALRGDVNKTAKKKSGTGESADGGNKPTKIKPAHPWTTAERLTAFYQKYVPEKMDGVPGLLEKYAGKEENLFSALVKKYGPEPLDPYFSDSDDDDGSDDDDDDSGDEKDVDGDDEDEEEATAGVDNKTKRSKRRGVGASKLNSEAGFTGRVLVQKEAKKKKRILTVVSGLEPALAVHQHKLKDATKAFAKAFAGSSSVKDNDTIIVQGDHVLELAELLVDKFQVPEECIYIDMGDGKVVNFLRG
jgi:density-regulated protein